MFSRMLFLSPGSYVQFRITATANTAGTASSTANVSSEIGRASCRERLETAVVTINATQADLSVTLTASPNPVLVGGTITYIGEYDNAGPQDATNVRMTLPLPAGVTFVSFFFLNGATAPASYCVLP